MKITQIEIFDVNLGPTHSSVWNPVVIPLKTDEGIDGVGEIALAYGTGSAAGVGMLRNLAERYLIGADPFRDACIPNFIIQEWFPYRKPENYQLVKQALEPQVVEGYLPIPEAPGLGVELDDEVITQYSCLRIE